MKLRVTFKTPDALTYALEDYPELTEVQREQAEEIAGKWIKYGEYITAEIDTDEETIRVLEA